MAYFLYFSIQLKDRTCFIQGSCVQEGDSMNTTAICISSRSQTKWSTPDKTSSSSDTNTTLIAALAGTLGALVAVLLIIVAIVVVILIIVLKQVFNYYIKLN